MNPFRMIRDYLNRRWMRQRGMVGRTSRKVQPGLSERFSDRFETSHWVGLLVFFLILCVSVFSVNMRDRIPHIPMLVENQQAPVTIFATFPFSYENEAETNKRISETLNSLPLFLSFPRDAEGEIQLRFQNILNEAKNRIQAERRKKNFLPGNSTAGELVAKYSVRQMEILGFFLNSSILRKQLAEQIRNGIAGGMLPLAYRTKYGENRSACIVDHKNRMFKPKKIKDFASVHEVASEISRSLVKEFSIETSLKSEYAESLAKLLLPLLVSGELTVNLKMEAESVRKIRGSTSMVISNVRKGDAIVQEGSTVTAADTKRLQIYKQKALERMEQHDQISRTLFTIRNILLCMMLMLFSGIYIYHIHPEILKSNQMILHMGLVTALAILLNMAASRIFFSFSEQESIPPWLGFLVLPLSFAPMVLSSIYGMRCALFSGLFIAAIAALSGTTPFDVVLCGLIVSGISAFAVRDSMNYRNHFIAGFLSVSVTTLLVGLMMMWYDKNSFETIMFPWILILPFAMGLATCMFVQITLYVAELFFGTATNMSLLLYSDYNHPLLKKMQFDAPGTYHHSLIVSTLAEGAAKEVGANPILARVGALFHDVGKLSQPEYFTENSCGENKHRDLSPKLSSLIILNHVKEGLELARKYKLKKPLRDAIRQHHGTDLVYFFYKKAKDSGELIDEHDFRYAGPIPQTKEIAILSLADACEAASRSLEKPTHGKIEEMVTEIFNKRLRNGQLDDANLTFRELTMIRNCFVKMLTSMLHARISYPKEERQDENDLFMDAAAKKTSENKTA